MSELSKVITWLQELLQRLMLQTSKNPLTYLLVSLITQTDRCKVAFLPIQAQKKTMFFFYQTAENSRLRILDQEWRSAFDHLNLVWLVCGHSQSHEAKHPVGKP